MNTTHVPSQAVTDAERAQIEAAFPDPAQGIHDMRNAALYLENEMRNARTIANDYREMWQEERQRRIELEAASVKLSPAMPTPKLSPDQLAEFLREQLGEESIPADSRIVGIGVVPVGYEPCTSADCNCSTADDDDEPAPADDNDSVSL